MSNQYDFTSKINFRGLWWLPENPDIKISGTLEFDQLEKSSLNLDGKLEKLEPGEDSLKSYPLINGITTNGMVCSLAGTYECSNHYNLYGVCSSLGFNKLLIGKKTFNPCVELIESVIVIFSNFNYWMQRDPINIDNSRMNKNIPEGRITFKLPKDTSIWVDSLDAHIRLEGGISTKPEYQKISLKMKERIRIVPLKKQKLGWYEDVIYKLRILFGILLGNSTNIISLILCPNRKKIKFPNSKIRMIREEISLLYKQLADSQNKEITHPSQIPFTFPVIGKDAFAIILNYWFGRSKNIETTRSLYFGSSINSQLPLEYRFLSMIQALEAYSRSKGNDKYIPDEASYKEIYKNMVNAIPSTIDKSHRDSLKSRVKYGNEYSLRKRFDNMLNSLPKEIREMVTNSDKKFVGKLIDTRNYLTHRDDTNQGNILDFKEIFNYTEKLKLMIEYFLLSECGLNEKIIIKTMTTHRAFKNRPKFL